MTEPERRERKNELVRQRERNWSREKEHIVKLPDIIEIQKTSDDVPSPLHPVVSDDESDSDSLVSQHESEGDKLEDDASITPTPPQSPEGAPVEAPQSPEGAPAEASPQRPIWKRDKDNRLKRSKLN